MRKGTEDADKMEYHVALGNVETWQLSYLPIGGVLLELEIWFE